MDIQMKRNDLIEPFMMISNWKKHFGLLDMLEVYTNIFIT